MNGEIKMNLDDMIAELEEFYECAGFEDYYERVLKNMSEEKIRAYYAETFKEEDRELENWEREYRGEE